MVTLHCLCAGSGRPETRESARFRLQGKEFFDDEGKRIAALSASSHAWELGADACGVLELELNVSFYFPDGARFGPFERVRICSSAIRAGDEIFAQFNGDRHTWCRAPVQQACDPVVFESA